MKILRKLTPYAQLSFSIGYTDNYKIGEIQVNDDVISDFYTSMISAVKIDAPEMDLVALRNNYIPNMVYPQYNPESDDIFHVSVDNKVYICLSNNGGKISTAAPSGTLLNNIIKNDGYVWAYIGTFNSADLDQNTEYITIPSKVYSTKEIGSIARVSDVISTTTNFDTQPIYKVIGQGSNAIFDISLDQNGDIVYISCANGGFGYDPKDYVVISDNFNGVGAQVNLKVNDQGQVELDKFTTGTGYTECSILVIGDGKDATIDFTTLNGNLTNVSVQDSGSGYTWAKAFVFSSESAIIANLKLLPMNGKATDPAYLMRSNTWRIRKTINVKDMEGYAYDDMKINMIALTDQYSSSPIAGLNNKYTGDIQLKYTTEVKEVYTINKIQDITLKENESINLEITVKLDGNKICQK